MKRFLLYLLRWQLSTPILALCLNFLHLGILWNTIIANIIGGCIFFWVDKRIFSNKKDDDYFMKYENEDDIDFWIGGC